MRPIIEMSEPGSRFVMSNKKFVGMTGGYRSLKTTHAVARHVRLAIINQRYLAQKGITGVVSAFNEPTYDMVIKSALPAWEMVTDHMKLRTTLRKTAPFSYTLHFPRSMGGDHTVVLGSIENYVRSAGMAWCHFTNDEADLIPLNTAQAAHRMYVSRLTAGKYLSGADVGTPEGYNYLNWFFNEDVLNPDGTRKNDRELIIAPTRTNPFIDIEEYVATMESQYDPVLLQAYLEGQFVNLKTGSVYRMFKRDLNLSGMWIAPKQGVPNHMIVPQDAPLCVGMDFNLGVMATVVVYVDLKTQIAHVVKEYIGDADTTAIANKLKRDFPRRRIIVFPDATGKDVRSTASNISDHAILRNAGFEVKANNSNGRIYSRVNAVNARLCNGQGKRQLLVNPIACPQTTKCLEQQTIKDGKPDKSQGLDHLPDALGYVINFLYPIVSNNSNQVEIW